MGKRIGFLVAVVLVAALAMTSSAGAATLKTTKPYSSFDNFKIGDCQYETAANLVLSRWPDAKISTAEVVSAYDTTEGAWDSSDDLWGGQDYLLDTGFAGHRASSITLLGPGLASVVAAANAGGVEVVNMGPVREHMFAIIHATSTTATVVDDGYVYHYSWLWLLWAYSQNNESLAFYGVTWAAS